MKINEILREGVLSSLGNLAHGAILGATGAMKNAPGRLDATTRLAADPSKMKALPNTFRAKKLGASGTDQDPNKQPVNVPGFTVINQEPIVIKYQSKDYALNNEGEWYPMSARGARPPLVKDTNPTLEKMLDKVAGF